MYYILLHTVNSIPRLRYKMMGCVYFVKTTEFQKYEIKTYIICIILILLCVTTYRVYFQIVCIRIVMRTRLLPQSSCWNSFECTMNNGRAATTNRNQFLALFGRAHRDHSKDNVFSFHSAIVCDTTRYTYRYKEYYIFYTSKITSIFFNNIFVNEKTFHRLIIQGVIRLNGVQGVQNDQIVQITPNTSYV